MTDDIANLETRPDGKRFLYSVMNPKRGWYVVGEPEPLLDGRFFLRSATHPNWGFIVTEQVVDGVRKFVPVDVVKNPLSLRLPEA
ncbi:MAG TPA: hypothetical protein VKB49_00140 [Candidatus Sulfotelmatobacter sp.]|nr:hypothetical protein [Candidatus Sulfotelmatobacter sp.]